jgi:hypothetical protein
MRGALAALTVGLLLTCDGPARAQTSPSRADEVRAPAVPMSQASPGVGAAQIAGPGGAADVNAAQIVTPSGGRAALAPAQLTGLRPRADAPPRLTDPSQDRNIHVAIVKGNDRCDPAAKGSAARPECAHIVDNRADEFAQPEAQSEPVVHPGATSSGLVSDILNGGTGSVVVLPGQ